jgi:prepilin-type processing-associated H-X9-DG protein
MLCPADQNPAGAHSYIVNKLVVRNQQDILKFGGKAEKNSSSEIIILGEKTTTSSDYYMERTLAGLNPDGSPNAAAETEFNRVVEQARHGVSRGSNYLMFDGHVEAKPPTDAKNALDPWEVIVPTPPPGP